MISDETKILDKIVKDLDFCLTEGFNQQKDIIKIWNKDHLTDGFSTDDYVGKIWENYNSWQKQVYDILNKLDLKYYLVHFLNPTCSSIDFVGIPNNLSRITVKYSEHVHALEETILMSEEKRNLASRREIADKEYNADILYEVTYSTHTREVKINNIQIAKTEFDSENDNVFAYIYRNPNRLITLEEIEKGVRTKLKKRLVDIIRDLGFTADLKTVFFPAVKKDSVKFINPITKQQAIRDDLPNINLRKIVR